MGWKRLKANGHTTAFAARVRFEKRGRLTIGRRKLASTNSWSEFVEQQVGDAAS